MIQWQRVVLIVPFNPEAEATPAEWDWAEIADLSEEPRVDGFGEVADNANDA